MRLGGFQGCRNGISSFRSAGLGGSLARQSAASLKLVGGEIGRTRTLSSLRRRILCGRHTARLFSGPVAEVLAVGGDEYVHVGLVE